ncbi:MAG: 4Fe-4S dicluster-binding protein [Methanogenium sp.]
MAVENAGADAIELNFSCPHGMPERGVGAAIGQHADLVRELTHVVRGVVEIPLIVKLTPNVTDIIPIARAATEGGADILSAINSVQCLMGVNLDTLEPLPSVGGCSTYGGYSGPAIKPIGLRVVSQIAQELPVPIMGIGGISSWQDAAEYIAVGASAVQVCTSIVSSNHLCIYIAVGASAVQVCTAVMWNGAGIIRDMTAGFSGYLADKQIPDPNALRCRALPRIGTHASLSRDSSRYAYRESPEQCISCGHCVIACRDGGYHAISVIERHVTIDKDTCDGCGLCSLVCSGGVIVMRPRMQTKE